MEVFKTTVINGQLFITDQLEHSHIAVQPDREISEGDLGYFINVALNAASESLVPERRFVFELTGHEGESIHDGGDTELLYDAVKFYFDTEFPGRPYTCSVPETSFVYEEPLSGDTAIE